MLRVSTVPSLLLTGASRTAIGYSQMRLVEAQKELGSGRHHDVGLVLGARTGSSIALRMKLEEINQLGEQAAQAGIKAEVVQSALGSMGNLAKQFLSTLSGARGAAGGQELVRNAAQSALEAFTSLINTSYDGQYLFGGINTDEPPLAKFESGAPQLAMDTAFQVAFGMAPSDAGVRQISGSDMAAFIDTGLADIFSSSRWSADWSQASATNLRHRAGDSVQVDISSNANAAFVSKLAQAFSMMTGLGQGSLSQAAFEQTVDKAVKLLSEAQLNMGDEQSRIGIAQQTLSLAAQSSERMKVSTTEAIDVLESVDPYAAGMRVNMLMTQLESSYAVAGRISRMSLLNYI